ncbi:methionyl-tRNA formyltransferase [Francisella tularensis]|uniref:Methionyl-tRNA formyltransferase n=5 Tax=Francisella tularensis TaxID=263 RepID=FMT_FRATT|nr:methionyl-tRNA formyltransferase [Francisella tularensis]A4IXN6.1 RecName: Full=Methionyl-tRNA formyltransferase [Francisella tularensis subsp. tularensis WY96-3418]Q14HS3.1 RecName: Full=Methionyl-tRNA formyltransferase [Francisella tularensis subsp. tularensis FSC198]Q5NGC1.1 RecName: Full=Methionyl-tRNA formyltransferase [Francisella tularensis subsp. tularensis SCHU S4]AAV29678.1 NT02FT0514 [synthetic construct]ABO46688.1 methionyl-tRNA formyltransferase [Francisella tularensis subsp. t
MKKLNIIFAGTPDISAQVLKDLYKSQHNIQAVLTQPDRAKGRGKKVQFSPVKEVALANHTPVFQPLSFKKNPEVLEQIKQLKPDVIVVIAYGIIVPQEFLDIPRYGCLNIHVSLLPKWRGAAPIQRAIQAGDTKTGVCIMQMDAGLDTGDILNTLEIEIQETDTSQTLHDKFAKLSIKPLLETLEKIEIIKPEPQQGEPTYAHKITKQEGLIDFTKSAWQISCHIRAFTPWPGAYFILDDEAIKVGEFEILYQNTDNRKAGTIIDIYRSGFDIATSDKIIRFRQLQFPNKKMLNIVDILNGKDLDKYIGYKLG